MNARLCLALALSGWLLVALLGQLNHYLAAWQLSVFCGGLFVTLAALRLDYRTGATGVFLIGLLLDAGAPLPFGTHALLFLTAFTVIRRAAARLHREEPVIQLIISLVANLALWIAISFVRMENSPSPGQAWVRALGDLVMSQLLIALIAPWFFSLQTRILAWSGLPPPRRAH